MQIWAGGMRKNFLDCWAVRVSLSLTRVQCLPILRDYYVLSHTLQDCVIEFGGGSASNATAAWAAKLEMNLQTSTLKFDETGEPLQIQQAAQIRAFRAAWKEAGHTRTPRISVSRSIFPLLDDRDRSYFGRGSEEEDKIGFFDENTQAIFGRGYAAEPDILIEQLRKDDAIAQADTLLLTIPS
jgi:alkanesulfonate monooxygenase SsuD/methylene tetrahydromethanopterin reductase-like flavin-dependent oxidoreductase (luciferase family)